MSSDAHDPGGKVRLPLAPGVHGSAAFSPCGRYRRELWRWTGATQRPFALWIGMNPSTADVTVDDPTVRGEWLRTLDLGFTAFCKANVLSYRATSPRDLIGAPVDDPENLATIRRLAGEAALVVLTVGVLPPPLRPYATDLIAALRADGRPLTCLGVTADGFPRHSLYIKRSVRPVPFP